LTIGAIGAIRLVGAFAFGGWFSPAWIGMVGTHRRRKAVRGAFNRPLLLQPFL
jgi:hypothetical protein